VWQGTKKLGCAVQSCPNGIENSRMAKGTLVVCQYSPPGNRRGAYADNVLPRRRQANPPAQPASQDRLPAGAKLSSPSCLLSSDKRFQLCLRDSGLLVLTQVDIKPHLPLWSSSGQSTMTQPFTAAVGPSGVLKGEQQMLHWAGRTDNDSDNDNDS
jgi:hypothetical protein